MLSLINQIRCQIVAVTRTFENVFVTLMKMSWFRPSIWTGHSTVPAILEVPIWASTAKVPWAELEVMGKSGLNILVPAFRFQCFVHIAISWSILSRNLVPSQRQMFTCYQKEPGRESRFGDEAGSKSFEHQWIHKHWCCSWWRMVYFPQSLGVYTVTYF